MLKLSQQVNLQLDIPANVGADQVFDFDLYADRRFQSADRPGEALSDLTHATGRGIFWTPRYGGHWFVNKHEIITQITRQPEFFSSSAAASLPPLPPDQEPWLPPLTLDPPEHAKYRLPLSRAFSPERVRKLEGDIRSLAASLVDAVAERGECEFVSEVAEPLPIIIFMKIMGLDLSRLREFRDWIRLMMSGVAEERLTSYTYITKMVAELIAERRKEPREDLVSFLLQQEVDGKKLDDRQMQGMSLLLFGAGLDSVVNAISFNMEFLARNPELQNRLRAAPNATSQILEAVMRVNSGVNAIRRVTKDMEFHGAKLQKGELVLLLFPLGNTDPAVFVHGENFGLDSSNPPVTFGVGIHQCVGAHLARLELKIFFEEWFRRMPNVRRNPAHRFEFRTGILFIADKLPLLWEPA
jgi:cytochrome P450